MRDESDPRLAWLELYDPRRAQAMRQRATVDLMVAAAAVPESVPANSIVGGADAASALALDKQIAAARGPGDPTPELIRLFKRSPLTGCTSIMDMALTSSGWNPLDPRQVGNYAGFMNYATTLGRTPFFTQPPATGTKTLPGGKNFNALIGQVANLMPGLTNADRERITTTVLHLAHAVFGPGGGGNVQRSAMSTLFTQQALGVNSGQIQINLYFCQVAMVYKHTESKHSSSTTEQSSFTVHRFTTGFQTSIWEQYAEAVAKKQITVVDEWLKKTTSPT